MSENDLIVQADGPEGLKGLGILDSGIGLGRGVTDGEWDALALSMDGFAFAIDCISMYMNPLGEVIKAGVGWLMEHLDMLREPLELLTGDAAEIEAVSQTWNNIAAELQTIADDYEGAVHSTANWEGDAATAYRTLATQYVDSLREMAADAASAAKGTTATGLVIGTARALVFDMIATFVSDVIARAIIAAATAGFTFGAAIAAFISSVLADLGMLMAKVQDKIGELLHSLEQLINKFRLLGDKSADAVKVLGRTASNMGNQANKAIKATGKMMDDLAPSGGRLKDYADHVARHADSPLSKGAPSVAVNTAKEAGQQVKEQVDQFTGGSPEDGRVEPTHTRLGSRGRITGHVDDE